MSLWNKTDQNASKPKFLSAAQLAGTTIVFVDVTEAQVPANRAKGIKIPGWHEVTEYVDNSGATRYKSQCLVALSETAVAAGDNTDDAIVGDTQFVIATQPVASTVATGVATSFVVAATGATGFQWQMRPAAGGQYTNLANAGIYSTVTTATLNISTGTTTAISGNRYRCIVGNTTAGASATSTAALLTVTA